MQGIDGYLYGTTQFWGTNAYGTVFKVSTNGDQTVLYTFTGGPDGGNPQAGLIQGPDGWFYGTTSYGGTNNWGTAFKIATNGDFNVLNSFGVLVGEAPTASLIVGSDGNFYGTTPHGGNDADGTVYRMTPSGEISVVASLGSFGSDGVPQTPVVQANDGSLYGTTPHSVFKLAPDGSYTKLVSLMGPNGSQCEGGLVQGNDGAFYGVTYGGGAFGAGTIFKITTDGVLTTLYSFQGDNFGSAPNDLILGSDGNFYGTTYSGGTNGSPGSVFQITPSGLFTELGSFAFSTGAYPKSALLQTSNANLFGTASYGGNSDAGSVFCLVSRSNTTWSSPLQLASFSGANGSTPSAGLVQGGDGALYGTTHYGGSIYTPSGLGYGTIFKVTTNGV
ncbi:MAG: choice-of-anchor tandem repeat GloVer-containing protein, partial [Limisphaerales bacterium]